MTVCVAAICSWVEGHYMIVGAADRMISTPDLAFEPEQSKIVPFSESIVGLIAGDPSAQISICDAVQRRLDAKPPETVEEVAKVYAVEWAEYRRQEAEQMVLRPLGLTSRSMVTDPDIREQTASDLMNTVQNYEIDTETLIVGKDGRGAHIFEVTRTGKLKCHDLTAFGAIGVGRWHAESHYMLSRYTKHWPFHKALLATLVAKRKAVVAPGVGGVTDFFFVDEKYSSVRDDLHAKLVKIVEEMEQDIAPIGAIAEEKVNQAVAEIVKSAGKEPEPEKSPDEGTWVANTWTGPTGPTPSSSSQQGPSLKIVPNHHGKGS